MPEQTNNVVPLDPISDPRVATLTDAIESLIRDRAGGLMPVATVLGILEIVKTRFLKDLNED